MQHLTGTLEKYIEMPPQSRISILLNEILWVKICLERPVSVAIKQC